MALYGGGEPVKAVAFQLGISEETAKSLPQAHPREVPRRGHRRRHQGGAAQARDPGRHPAASSTPPPASSESGRSRQITAGHPRAPAPGAPASPSFPRCGRGGCPPSVPARPACRRRRTASAARRITPNTSSHSPSIVVNIESVRLGSPESRTTFTAAATASCTESESDPPLGARENATSMSCSNQPVCSSIQPVTAGGERPDGRQPVTCPRSQASSRAGRSGNARAGRRPIRAAPRRAHCGRSAA